MAEILGEQQQVCDGIDYRCECLMLDPHPAVRVFHWHSQTPPADPQAWVDQCEAQAALAELVEEE